jgi:uncharacterized membrane protein (UPF0127 family)
MTTPEQARRTATLQAAGRTLTVELALDDASRSRGLKHRTQLAPDAGMLFVFTSPRPQRFWMQDTLIPLDILFLDPDGTVQNVARGEPGVEQPGYTSRGAALDVLELAAGWCEQHGLKPGDKVVIPPELARLAR